MSARERDYRFLRAELGELDYLLSITPESAVVDRMSLQARRSQVVEELEANPPPTRWPASVRLAFNGKPVADREGIYADFAGKAVGAFAEAVTSLAAGAQAPLGERGVIPGRERYRLLITGTSTGSFGFEVEEALEQSGALPEASPVELAIEQAKGILESLNGDEETIAEAIADTDERAIHDLRDFLKVMADNEAVCSLSFKNDVFRFRNVGHVRLGLNSLQQENLHEGKRTMLGRFQGFLPQGRRAEFEESETGEVHSCRVDRTMPNAEAINEVLGQSVVAHVRYRQVGNSRARYTITGYEAAPPIGLSRTSH